MVVDHGCAVCRSMHYQCVHIEFLVNKCSELFRVVFVLGQEGDRGTGTGNDAPGCAQLFAGGNDGGDLRGQVDGRLLHVIAHVQCKGFNVCGYQCVHGVNVHIRGRFHVLFGAQLVQRSIDLGGAEPVAGRHQDPVSRVPQQQG